MVRLTIIAVAIACGASCASTADQKLSELRHTVDALSAREVKLSSQVADLSHQVLLLNERAASSHATSNLPQNLEVVRLVPQQDTWQDSRPIDINIVGEPDPERLPTAKLPPAPVHKQSNSVDGDRVFRDALQAFRDGKPNDAYQLLGTFVRNYPNHPDVESAQYWMGEARFEAQAYGEAIASYETLLQRYPGSGKAPDALWKMGLSYERTGKTDLAKQAFEKLLRAYPKSSLADIARARLGGGA